MGQHSRVKRPVIDRHTITNPPTEQLIINPAKFAPSFTSTTSILNPLKTPFQASITHFLKSLIRFNKERLTVKIAATIPIKKPI